MQLIEKLFIILLIAIVFDACSGEQSEKACSEPVIKKVYSMRGCNGDKCGYFHTLMLDKYIDDCFNNYDFVYLADRYLDSVKNDVPVCGITFVKPFDFEPAFDSRDFEPIREHTIVEIFYTDSTIKNKVPEIEVISIWAKGVRKDLEYMHVSSRLQRMNYYHRKKN